MGQINKRPRIKPVVLIPIIVLGCVTLAVDGSTAFNSANEHIQPSADRGGDDGAGLDVSTGQTAEAFKIAGQVQKGPLIFGSRIMVAELTNSLSPNGRVFVTRTSDDLGRFSLPSSISAPYVEVMASGYYFDEISGALSGAPIELRAIVNLVVDATPTVNILTTLQAPRLSQLISEGMDYPTARAQSETEVLRVFGINGADIQGSGAFFEMNLDGTSDRDSVLIAATTVLAQAAFNAITENSPEQAAHMSVLLSDIGDDLMRDGDVENTAILTALGEAARVVSLPTVRENIERYYESQGVSIATPLFEEWIDKEGSGVLPQRRPPVAGIGFTDLTDQEAFAEVASNTVSFSSLADGVNVQVSVSAESQIIKNGSVVDGLFTTVGSGDTLYLKTTTAGFGNSRRVLLNVGSGTVQWNVTTKNLKFIDIAGGGPGCSSGYFALEEASWFAVPFQTDAYATFRYAGLGLYASSTISPPPALRAIYLYSDDGGRPGSVIATSESVRQDAGAGFVTSLDGSFECGFSGPQAFFGNTGVPVLANTTYWIVVQYDISISVGLIGPLNSAGPEERQSSLDGISWKTWMTQGESGSERRVPQWFLVE
jgi:hypothetical protein